MCNSWKLMPHGSALGNVFRFHSVSILVVDGNPNPKKYENYHRYESFTGSSSAKLTILYVIPNKYSLKSYNVRLNTANIILLHHFIYFFDKFCLHNGIRQRKQSTMFNKQVQASQNMK